jgi:flagellar L-ring protein precursor FlgH
MQSFAGKALLIAGLAATLAGCAVRPDEFMKEPKMSPIGAGLAGGKLGDQQDGIDRTPIGQTARPIANLYTDQTVTRVGDIVTVNIAINDKAQFDNATDRSKTSAASLTSSWGYTRGGSSGGGSQPSSTLLNANSSSSFQGQGNIDRQEQIQVSVAAVVTEVLPNGNLVISGSQEVRVNFELRQLTVAGIVRPYDIARNNTISYDRIAEARISYGGRGRVSEVQQPNWGQQIWDAVSPF